MPTTTNYGWDIPADTDLVKDGALAMRTLGNSIDTTTKNLNPETTLGDISYRSSTANTNTRLAIGTSGQILTVSGGVPAWVTPAAAGGMTQLATGTLSGTAVNLTSISGSYKDLVLVIRNYRPANDATALLIRFNNDSNTRYFDQISLNNDNQGFGTDLLQGPVVDNGTSNGLEILTIWDYANTSTWKFAHRFAAGVNSSTTTNAIWQNRYIGYNQTAAITQINLFTGGGNSFTSGTYILYGVS